MESEIAPAAALRAALDALADGVEGFTFDLPSAGRDGRRGLQRELSWSIREYLVPRLGDLDAPAIAIVIGSTGSGKSTLVNTLAQEEVSRPGALRPTTRTPVVWTRPEHADRYRNDFLTGYGSGPHDAHGVTVIGSDHELLAGVTVVDSPDFDSIVEENRAIADDLLAVADLCVFVTSAQRYADAVPWSFLERARRRGLPLFFVINRVPAGVGDEVVADYERRLSERGLLGPGTELLTIGEQEIISAHGGLTADTVDPLRSRLHDLGDPDRRMHLIREATHGAALDATERARRVADEVDEQRAEAEALLDVASRAYAAQTGELHRLVVEGSLIRGEVIARWQDFVGTGQFLQAIEEGAGRLRRWFRRVFGGTPEAEVVEREARSELEAAVVRRADLAANAAAGAWELDAAGKEIIAESDGALWWHDPRTEGRARTALEDWMADVTKLVTEHGAGKKRIAQIASYGVNAVAVATILGVFVHTGGLTGAELGVTAGAAAAQQTLLEHIFGSAAARTLMATARERLDAALAQVLESDRERFVDAVGKHLPPETTAGELRSLLGDAEAEIARFYR